MNSADKGHLAFLKVEARALEHGATVSKPTREGTRYDAIIDWAGKLYRAQIKWANMTTGHSTGAVKVKLQKHQRSGKVTRPFYTSDEIDVLLLYIPQIDKVLWVGPEQFHQRQSLIFRYAPSRNNQVKRCLMADDFVW